MTIKHQNAFKIYKKIEKGNDLQKSPYEAVYSVLTVLHRNIQLMIIDIDKKRAFSITKRKKELFEVQKSLTKYLVRSLTSIYALQTTLNFDKGGVIATNLFQLYEFCRLQIINSFTKNENKGLKKASESLQEIIYAWSKMEKNHD